jgi:hypothetical protein
VLRCRIMLMRIDLWENLFEAAPNPILRYTKATLFYFNFFI